jgi:hypothetical protein
LVARLEAQRLVGLMDASGSGKFSLARGGAALAYEQRDWVTTVFRPGLQPLRAFANSIAGGMEGALLGRRTGQQRTDQGGAIAR